MRYPKNYSKAVLTASRESINTLIDGTGELILALETLQHVTKDIDTPMDPQVFHELEALFATANRMLHSELAGISHLEQMQQMVRKADKAHKEISGKKSSQAQTATA